MTMSKRLNRLIERDGAFHDLSCDGGYSETFEDDELEKLLSSVMDEPLSLPEEEKHETKQIWREGNADNVLIEDDLIVNFSPGFGYSLTLDTGHEKEIRGLTDQVASMARNNFELAPNELEKVCNEINDINKKLKFENLKDAYNLPVERSLGSSTIIENEFSTLYLMRDGVGAYVGDKEKLPLTRNIRKILLKDGITCSKEFKEYLNEKNMGFSATFEFGQKSFPTFNIYNNSKRETNERLLSKILIDREFQPVWKMKEYARAPKELYGEHFRVKEPTNIIYKDATNFHRIYSSGFGNHIYVEIPRGYRNDLDPKKVRKDIWENVKEMLKGEYPSLADGYLFGVELHGREPSWDKMKNDKDFRNEIVKRVIETSNTPSIETLSGDIKMISHCPYLKINGADKIYGSAPENFKYEINCNADGCDGVMEVIYDYE